MATGLGLLVEKGLMFGNLVRIDSPVLVERYRRAMQHLTGRITALDEFHIDISGFSPEIGDELGDDLYLNPGGVNRQFILLTTEQQSAPLLNAQFSTSRGILRQFIEGNEAQLFGLTARDAVAGELADTVFRVARPADLFKIGRITVEADTAAGTVASARQLEERIARFRREPDAWWDDVLIAEMISLAGETGDLTRNPVTLERMTFEQENFWTAHFGGLYLFRKAQRPFAVTPGDAEALGELPLGRAMGFEDRTRIARTLIENQLVEGIVDARGIDAAAILQQKMDFIVAEVAAASGEDLTGATRRDLRAWARRHAGTLPEEWQGLAALARWAGADGAWPTITSEHPAYFYTLRGAAGPDRDLVNMLLAELAPLDVRQLFICHKEAFYRAYAGWPAGKQTYVAQFLQNEYMMDKAGTRRALFGAEPGMDDPGDGRGDRLRAGAGGAAPSPWGGTPAGRQDDLAARISAVGPWGAIGRR
ncbi:hypothetical protein GCM10011392_29020 [Wenxinia marina]|uniref:DUF6638 family protein n=1 Tax=Wenxinia marina TaxID=390641 RepID=UPI0003796EB9|nr:hypothetical protein GCM10011392_29020 [Wenxinia marina]